MIAVSVLEIYTDECAMQWKNFENRPSMFDEVIYFCLAYFMDCPVYCVVHVRCWVSTSCYFCFLFSSASVMHAVQWSITVGSVGSSCSIISDVTPSLNSSITEASALLLVRVRDMIGSGRVGRRKTPSPAARDPALTRPGRLTSRARRYPPIKFIA